MDRFNESQWIKQELDACIELLQNTKNNDSVITKLKEIKRVMRLK